MYIYIDIIRIIGYEGQFALYEIICAITHVEAFYRIPLRSSNR